MTAPNYQSTSQQSSVSLDNVSMHGNNNNYAILFLILLMFHNGCLTASISIPQFVLKSKVGFPKGGQAIAVGSLFLTLLMPSYFGPTLYTQGVIWFPPTISSTLGCTNLKFCKVVEIPFKVSENTRFVQNLLYGYHGNCLIT